MLLLITLLLLFLLLLLLFLFLLLLLLLLIFLLLFLLFGENWTIALAVQVLYTKNDRPGEGGKSEKWGNRGSGIIWVKGENGGFVFFGWVGGKVEKLQLWHKS